MAETTTKTMSSRGDYNAIADRLTDTLNLEVIEPVLRVYRAYQHSVKAPHCQEHLMCLVNRHHDGDKKGEFEVFTFDRQVFDRVSPDVK